MKKHLITLIVGMSAVAVSPFASAENYCLTKEARKQLSQAENSFIRKQLKAKGVKAKDIKVQYAVKETPNSMGGPEFKCAGKVTVTSKAANAQVLSYDIGYSVFMDEGMVGIDKKKISRKNVSN